MSGLNVFEDWFRPRLSRLNTSLRPYTLHLLAGVSALAVVALLAGATSLIQPEDRIVVGNTGGTLSVLLELDESRVLLGAGPSRSHSANLVGYTTQPWDREIDLLLLPGWDDHHVAGAIGLLERRSVLSIVVVGLPGEEPVWTHLEREAERSDVPVRYLDRTHKLRFGQDSRLTMTPMIRESEGAWFRLDHHGKRVDIIDVRNPETGTPDPGSFASDNDHVIVNTRNQRSPEALSPELIVGPMAHWQRDYTELRSSYWAGIERNEHVVLRLTEDQITLPLDSVTDVPD